MSAGPAEVAGLDQSIVYAQHLAVEAEAPDAGDKAYLTGDTASSSYAVTGTDGEGPVIVAAWQYKIARRPVGAAR